MNWFKRLCLFVFGLSGVLSLAALCLVWVGPWTTQARTLITENYWYFVVLEVLVCISALGLLACMLIALFAPRNPKATVVAELDGGKITVTRTAIATQTRHIIEADGTCEPVSVNVKVRKRGHVQVHARVRPNLPLNVVERGAILHSELEQGLSKICGESVDKIGLAFTEPAQQGSLSTYVDTDAGTHGQVDAYSGGASTSQGGQDITVAIPPRTEEIVVESAAPSINTFTYEPFEPVAEEPVTDDFGAMGWDVAGIDSDAESDATFDLSADPAYEEQDVTSAEEV